jgi:hypothetical protein
MDGVELVKYADQFFRRAIRPARDGQDARLPGRDFPCRGRHRAHIFGGHDDRAVPVGVDEIARET